jgi:hypothetical protein
VSVRGTHLVDTVVVHRQVDEHEQSRDEETERVWRTAEVVKRTKRCPLPQLRVA